MPPVSDGVITLRRFAIGDRRRIVDERDEECERWLGPGAPDPSPTACIEVDGDLVGWIDADLSPGWLLPGETNVGYSVFPTRRGNGYATRAVRLFVAELDESVLDRAVLVIDVANHASVRVARAAGARLLGDRVMPEFPTSAAYALELGPHNTR